MIRGIFRCDSSLMAICSASVSPSKGTSTGAFILSENRYEHLHDTVGGCINTHLICNALVPNIRARSYFVKYGVVTRSLFGCLSPCKPTTPPPSAWPAPSPLAMSASWSAPLTPFANGAPSSSTSREGSPSGS